MRLSLSSIVAARRCGRRRADPCETGIISSNVIKRDSLLFVYGTLRAFVDIPMARRLRRCARHLGTARTPGRLYDLGPYPGLTAPPAARRMGGRRSLRAAHAARAPASARPLRSGCRGPERPRFVRVRAAVVLADGGRRCAWLYLYRRRCVRRRGFDAATTRVISRQLTRALRVDPTAARSSAVSLSRHCLASRRTATLPCFVKSAPPRRAAHRPRAAI